MNNLQAAGKSLPLWAVHLLMLAAATLVSTSFTVGKAIAPGMDPAILTLVRFILASLLFLPYIYRQYGLKFPSPAALARYSIISGALVAFFWLMFLSLRFTTALNTSVIFTLVPGISGIYSAIILRERLGRYRLIALLLAMIGAIWVIFEGDIQKLLQLQLGRGDLIFFYGCLFMAAYTPLVKLLHRGEPMAVMTFWVTVTGSFWLLILGGNRLFGVPWQSIEPLVWYGIVYLAIFCTIITFFLTQISTLSLGPTRVMAYSYLYPPLVIIIDRFLGHGLPPLRTIIGVLIIVPAMLIVQSGATNGVQGETRAGVFRGPRKEHPSSPPSPLEGRKS
ncbi:MAG: DMT family transporter [Desulfobulbaceae bacterium]|nr:DMT family transporter [Desulfobulbaceae bacterium]